KGWDAAGRELAGAFRGEGNRGDARGQTEGAFPGVGDPLWERTGDLGVARQRPGGATLPNGKGILGGRTTSKLGEVFDPLSGTFTATNNVTKGLQATSAPVPLSKGEFLVAAGWANDGIAYVYKPTNNAFVPTSTKMHGARPHASVTRLATGDVL